MTVMFTVMLLWPHAVPSLLLSPWFEGNKVKTREIQTRTETRRVRVDRSMSSPSTHFQAPGILNPNPKHVFLRVLLPQKSQQPKLSQAQTAEAGVQAGGVNSRTNKEQ